jgi:hypothetical protein
VGPGVSVLCCSRCQGVSEFTTPAAAAAAAAVAAVAAVSMRGWVFWGANKAGEQGTSTGGRLCVYVRGAGGASAYEQAGKGSGRGCRCSCGRQIWLCDRFVGL